MGKFNAHFANEAKKQVETAPIDTHTHTTLSVLAARKLVGLRWGCFAGSHYYDRLKANRATVPSGCGRQ